AVADPHSRLRVVTTLRADFYDRPLLYSGFAELLRDYVEAVVPLRPDEFERAISGPAERVGATLEPGLLAEMIADVAAWPGSRPRSFDRDPRTGTPTIEVAHEALLREWARLRRWIDAAREDLRMHRRLLTAASEWAESGRDQSFVLRGGHLTQFKSWSEESGLALTGLERE